MRFDSIISHLCVMKGMPESDTVDGIDPNWDTSLPRGRYAPAVFTDESVRAACYCYGSYQAVPDSGDGHWAIPYLPKSPEMAFLNEFFSMGIVSVLHGRAFMAGPALKEKKYSQWAKNGFLPASATVVGCIISQRMNEFIKISLSKLVRRNILMREIATLATNPLSFLSAAPAPPLVG